MAEPRILIFAGSTRRESINHRLAETLAAELPSYGGVPTLISLSDYPMPMYNGDLEKENGVPAEAQKLANLIADHDGVIIVSPEYNASPPPLLKNVIDWISRPIEIESGRHPYKSPVFALAGASPGGLGTIRNFSILRQILELGVGALVIAEQLGVGQAHSAYDDDGKLAAEPAKKLMDAMLTSLVSKARALKGK